MYKMVLLVLVGLCLGFESPAIQRDFEQAKTDAKKEHKLILLRFSGSDWCLPCIKMENEVFRDDSFVRFAAANLFVVVADFPRLKKHKLPENISSQNDALADRYNKDGRFPLLVLMDAEGKVLREWDGYNGEKPAVLIQQIKYYAGAN